MAYHLQRSGVITGCINSFCLACDMFLKSEQEANKHIKSLNHKKELGTIPYSDKFKDEHIRKFTVGYFCEFCNLLLPIAAKVNIHITEGNHIHHKGTLLLMPMGNDVVAYNNVLIKEKAWHGLMEEICSVCNAEFDDENEHKSDASHNLNLIRKPIKFTADNDIYRPIDESAVQCLTCNQLIAPSTLTKHFYDTEHRELYSKHRIETNGVSGNIYTEKSPIIDNDNKTIKTIAVDTESKKNKILSIEDKSKIIESITKYQSKGININLETETAFCKKCSIVVQFNPNQIDNHIEEHSTSKKVDSELLYPSNPDQDLNRVNINDKSTSDIHENNNNKIDSIKMLPEITSCKDQNKETILSDSSDSEIIDIPPNPKINWPRHEDVVQFAKENNITYNSENGKAYCRVCDVRLPSSYKSMKEHATGANHRKNVDPTEANVAPFVKPTAALSKQDTRHFVDSVFGIQSIFSNETVINETYCIPKNSYCLISSNNTRFRCITCEVNLARTSDITAHIKTEQHIDRVDMTPVITSEKTEFIREIRSNLYHCGFCNLVVNGWGEMKLHLKCNDHKEKRAYGERRLQCHMPDIRRHKMQREMQALHMLWMMDRLF